MAWGERGFWAESLRLGGEGGGGFFFFLYLDLRGKKEGRNECISCSKNEREMERVILSVA